MQNFLKLVNSVFAIILLVIAVVEMSVESILIVLIAVLPFLLKKILKYNASQEMILFCYIFFTASFVMGVVYHMYRTTQWADLLAHFLSGVFFTIIGLWFIKTSGLLLKKQALITALFLLGFSAFIAFFWETCEYTYDTLFDKDTQWVEKTGVTDTMEDMIIAFLGSVIVTGVYTTAIVKNPKKTKEIVEHII